MDETAWDAVKTEWKESTKMVEGSITQIAKEVVRPRIE